VEKFQVYGSETVDKMIIVLAESEEEAIKKAKEIDANDPRWETLYENFSVSLAEAAEEAEDPGQDR